jgi:hypothetical protein
LFDSVEHLYLIAIGVTASVHGAAGAGQCFAVRRHLDALMGSDSAARPCHCIDGVISDFREHDDARIPAIGRIILAVEFCRIMLLGSRFEWVLHVDLNARPAIVAIGRKDDEKLAADERRVGHVRFGEV